LIALAQEPPARSQGIDLERLQPVSLPIPQVRRQPAGAPERPLEPAAETEARLEEIDQSRRSHPRLTEGEVRLPEGSRPARTIQRRIEDHSHGIRGFPQGLDHSLGALPTLSASSTSARIASR